MASTPVIAFTTAMAEGQLHAGVAGPARRVAAPRWIRRAARTTVVGASGIGAVGPGRQPC
jgi:hypothetical protein